MDCSDRGGEFRLELRHLVAGERAPHGVFGPLEKDVGDFDLIGARAERGQRVHEPLQRIVVLERFLRGQVLEAVRLVIDDESPVVPEAEEIEAPVEKDAVVLEGERELRLRLGAGSKLGRERRGMPGVDERRDASNCLLYTSPSPRD